MNFLNNLRIISTLVVFSLIIDFSSAAKITKREARADSRTTYGSSSRVGYNGDYPDASYLPLNYGFPFYPLNTPVLYNPALSGYIPPARRPIYSYNSSPTQSYRPYYLYSRSFSRNDNDRRYNNRRSEDASTERDYDGYVDIDGYRGGYARSGRINSAPSYNYRPPRYVNNMDYYEYQY